MESLIIIFSLLGFIVLLIIIYFIMHLVYKNKKVTNLPIMKKESNGSQFYLDSFLVIMEIINSNDTDSLKKAKLIDYKKSHYYVFNLHLVSFNSIIVDFIEKLIKTNSQFWKEKYNKEIITLENEIIFLEKELKNSAK